MAILSKSGFYGALQSVKATGAKVYNRLGALVPAFVSTFVSGWAGNGWAIRNTASEGENWEAEFDSLTIRKTMHVFELLISRIRAVNGGLVISHANGKIKEITENSLYYEVRLEDDAPAQCEFVNGDFVRMQVFRNNATRYYQLLVLGVTTKTEEDGTEYFVLRLFKNTNMDAPEVGDEIVQFGNTSNVDRQSAIYMRAAAGGGTIDLLDGIKGVNTTSEDSSDILSSWVVMRIGADIPQDGGRGFYCKNGTIISTNTYTTDDGEQVTGNAYEFHANGSGQVAYNGVSWDEKGNVTLGKNVTISWDSLSDETKTALTPVVVYSADGTNWHEGYVSGDTWMRVSYNGTNSDMRIQNDGDSAYVYIRYGYQEAYAENPTTGEIIYKIVMLPESPTAAQLALATHIGQATGASPTAPTDVDDYTWTRFKGEDGKDANLLDWVKEWNGNTTLIGSDYVISPKMFCGTNTGGLLTGVAVGRDIVTCEWVDGVPTLGTDDATAQTGIYGINDSGITFAIDASTGNAYFRGTINATAGHFTGSVTATSGSFTGEVNATTITANNGTIGGFALSDSGFTKSSQTSVIGTFTSTLTSMRVEFTNEDDLFYAGMGVDVTDSENYNTFVKLRNTAATNVRLLSLENTQGTAIDLRGGNVQGYCASIRVIDSSDSTSVTIQRGVNVIVIDTSRTMSVTLPDMSDAGNSGYIMQISSPTSGTATIYSSDRKSTWSISSSTKGIALVWSATKNKWYQLY